MRLPTITRSRAMRDGALVSPGRVLASAAGGLSDESACVLEVIAEADFADFLGAKLDNTKSSSRPRCEAASRHCGRDTLPPALFAFYRLPQLWLVTTTCDARGHGGQCGTRACPVRARIANTVDAPAASL